MEKERPVSENSVDNVRSSFFNYLAESGKAPLTIKNFKRTLRYFYSFLKQKGINTISDVTQDIIAQYQDYVYETLDHAENTLRFYINDMRRFFDHLIKMGIVYDNPIKDIQIKQKKIETVEVITRYYSIEEIIRKYRNFLKTKNVSFSFYETEKVNINTFLYFLEKTNIA